MQTVYNTIGKTYDITRKADPLLAAKLLSLLNPHKKGHYLDVGCGSGNYTQTIHATGYKITGIDISDEMLGKAKQKYPEINWVQGDAKSLPFASNHYDGATCFLATHHIKDIETSFKEVHRVIGSGNFVIFTSFPEQMQPWWLNRYFPELMRLATELMHSKEQLMESLDHAGFRNIRTDIYHVDNALQDWFLQSGKYRPEIYLDPAVRAGISTFALKHGHDEILTGCEKLRQDIESGVIQSIISDHESPLGDYVFLTGTK